MNFIITLTFEKMQQGAKAGKQDSGNLAETDVLDSRVHMKHMMISILTTGYFEFRGQESMLTTIFCPLSISPCLVSIRILGTFLSAATKRCLVAFNIKSKIKES